MTALEQPAVLPPSQAREVFRTGEVPETTSGRCRGHARANLLAVPRDPFEAVPAAEVTASHPLAHGAPVHAGDPAEPGIASLDAPGFGDALEFATGRMLITDRTDESLAQ